MGLLNLTGIPSSLAQGHGGQTGEEALSHRNSPENRQQQTTSLETTAQLVQIQTNLLLFIPGKKHYTVVEGFSGPACHISKLTCS